MLEDSQKQKDQKQGPRIHLEDCKEIQFDGTLRAEAVQVGGEPIEPSDDGPRYYLMTRGLLPEDVSEARAYETLGPVYFAARRVAEGFLKGADLAPIQKITTSVVDDIRDGLYEYLEGHILSDLESNIQGHVQRLVENTVEALLTGADWAMRQYPLADYSRGERIRAAVCKHGGEGILQTRIAELEAEVERLNKSLSYAYGR